jgi:chromosome segregation ATPase
MWIERIEFVGFGNLVNQKIEFSRSKLNLVVESNEYGKSTIGDAIWAVLFDYPDTRTSAKKLSDREARQPAAGGPYKVCLDIVHKDRSLRIVRDFAAKTVRVFDQNKGDIDVTTDYLSGPTQDDLGQKLTGMSRDLFRNTFFVGQGDLDSNALNEADDLSPLLQSLADSSGAATTSATAVSVLETALAHFPYQGIRVRADKLLQQLESEQERLQVVLSELSSEHEGAQIEFGKLTELENKIQSIDMQSKASDYFQLCMEAADVDSRLIKAQERVLRVNDLKTQLAKLSEFKEFPVERSRSVEELWTKRESRLSDHQRMELELKLKEKQVQARQLEIREKWEDVNQFTVEDAQNISSLARTLGEVKGEISDSKRKRDDEAVRVKEVGVELDKLSSVRSALLNLDARDMDNAQAYNAMITAARDQIRECEGTVWRARQILPEIEEQRKGKLSSCRNSFFAQGILFVIFAGLVGAMMSVFHMTWSDPRLLASVVPLLVVAGWVLFTFMQLGAAKSYRAEDAKKAKDDEQSGTDKGTELHQKIMGLEIRLDDLARKAGITSGAELTKHIQSYGTASAQLKDLDLLDQMLDGRESHLVKLAGQLEPYFTKAKRNADKITSELAFKLADDINQFLEESRTVSSSSGALDHHRSELKFLADEIKDIDAQLKEHFDIAKVEHPGDPAVGYQEFTAALKSYRQWESLMSELGRMEQDTTSDLPVGELPSIVSKLETRRKTLWSKIEDLIARYPDIGQLAPPLESPTVSGSSAELPAGEAALDEMRKQREELLVKTRAATGNYDERYVRTVEELEDLEFDIEHVRRGKSALELARDTFLRLSEETHSHWSSRLNEISKEMLQSLSTDFESFHFDPELRLTARRKGQSEPLQPANINSQASGGTREQLHLLARMVVAKHLAEQSALPIILDEPFSESDDGRFLSVMRFLLGTMVGQHQVILFSCHHNRHQWLVDQLSEEQRDLVQQCRLEPLAVMSDATSSSL